MASDHKELGHQLNVQTQQIDVEGMADTGCQSCHVGFKITNRIGLKREDLIPVTMQMHAANNKTINILGAAILQYLSKS